MTFNDCMTDLNEAAYRPLFLFSNGLRFKTADSLDVIEQCQFGVGE